MTDQTITHTMRCCIGDGEGGEIPLEVSVTFGVRGLNKEQLTALGLAEQMRARDREMDGWPLDANGRYRIHPEGDEGWKKDSRLGQAALDAMRAAFSSDDLTVSRITADGKNWGGTLSAHDEAGVKRSIIERSNWIDDEPPAERARWYSDGDLHERANDIIDMDRDDGG